MWFSDQYSCKKFCFLYNATIHNWKKNKALSKHEKSLVFMLCFYFSSLLLLFLPRILPVLQQDRMMVLTRVRLTANNNLHQQHKCIIKHCKPPHIIHHICVFSLASLVP